MKGSQKPDASFPRNDHVPALRYALAAARDLLDMPALYRGEHNYSEADVIRELIRHAKMAKAAE